MRRVLQSIPYRALGAALAVLSAASPAPGAPSSAAGDDVSAALVADVRTIAPGSTFTVGIDIKMGPGWHTYWENGGDAGLPTSVEWTLPAGFEASEILWPIPHRYEEEGDVVTFGYADRVLLLTEITAPDAIDADRVEIRGAVEWLQCKDICIPGGDDVALVLEAGSSVVPAPDAVVARFEATRKLHPVSAAIIPNLGVHAFQDPSVIAPGESGEVAVVFSGLGKFDAAASEFFPRPSMELWFRDGEVSTDGANLAVVIPVEVDATVEAGAVVPLPGVIRVVSASGDARLYSFEIPVSVAGEGEAAVASTAPVFTGSGPYVTGGPSAPGAAATVSLARLLRYLLLAFLGGMILNVMPCVLPVVSLKILGFVSKSEEHPGKVMKLGLTFGAGVVVSFVVLALLVIALQQAGQHVGWGFQFQDPLFVAGLSVVVFVFSLSLLGVFEVGVTMSMIGLGLAAAQRKDYADAFFHGILTTVLATPCTAPMLGTAVAFAFSQPPAIILAIFLAVSFGLAAPYVALSMHPGWLKYVPKPGAWMDTFKQGMGFLLLATLVWLLSVFGAQTGPSGLVWLLAFLLVLGLFAWIHGKFIDLTTSGRKRLVIWTTTIVAVVWSYEAFLHDTLFPDPALAAMPNVQAGLSERAEITDGGTVWEPFSTAYLDEAVAAGRTVFIDFTAEWCWTCKVNEKTVLADADVEDLFRENNVLTLKGDWTRKDPEITEILQRHNRAGVPFYAVYPAGRPGDVIVLPEIINKKLVLKSLHQAGPSKDEETGA